MKKKVKSFPLRLSRPVAFSSRSTYYSPDFFIMSRVKASYGSDVTRCTNAVRKSKLSNSDITMNPKTPNYQVTSVSYQMGDIPNLREDGRGLEEGRYILWGIVICARHVRVQGPRRLPKKLHVIEIWSLFMFTVQNAIKVSSPFRLPHSQSLSSFTLSSSLFSPPFVLSPSCSRRPWVLKKSPVHP